MDRMSRVTKAIILALFLLFFIGPLIWLVLTPFSARPSMSVALPGVTLDNLSWVKDTTSLLPFLSSAIISLGCMALVVLTGSIGAYGLSRSGFRGKGNRKRIRIEDESGKFRFGPVKAGKRTVWVEDVRKQLDLAAGETVNIEFVIENKPK